MPVKNKKKTRKPNYSQDPILYDHFGNPLEEVLKRDKETVEKKKEELAQVAALVSESRGEAGGLLSKNFLIVSCNIFLKTDSTQAVVLPAEVGIVRFSLEGGVDPEDVFHAFPQPGHLPVGYGAAVIEASKGGRVARGHQVPWPELTEPLKPLHGKEVVFERSTPEEFCSDLTDYLGGETQIFCPTGAQEEVEQVLNSLFARASLEKPSFSILPLHALLHNLALNSVPSLCAAELQLDTDKFQYTLDHLCPWHEAYTDNNRCSVAVARRLAFAVLDRACPDNDVDIVPGRHIPEDSLPDPNRPVFDWGPSELVLDRKEMPRRGGTRERGNHLEIDFFSGSHDYSGFASTDVRMRTRHHYPPEQDQPGGSTAGTISAYLGDPTNRSEVVDDDGKSVMGNLSTISGNN